MAFPPAIPQPSGVPLAVIPPGMEAIHNLCKKHYPNQPNPLQVTAVVKYWAGGPDPLDYVSMYENPGNPSQGVPPHWHYISFGLSDLHGDGRVHDVLGPDSPSGFGFELTFRLKRQHGEDNPPIWPATLMQALARYVFQSDNKLHPGDHVSWHTSLDNSDSYIQHILLAEDCQLQTMNSQLGTVTYIQIVGVCKAELQAAQHWNVSQVLELLRSANEIGTWLITDMKRRESIFEMNPSLHEAVQYGIRDEGSNLSGVMSFCWWQEEQGTLNGGVHGNRGSRQPKAISAISGMSLLRPVVVQGTTTFESSMSVKARFADSVHLRFNLEAAALLPLALCGRLLHGRHFTYKSKAGDVAITFVTDDVEGSLADSTRPFAMQGPWLHVFLRKDDIHEILKTVGSVENTEEDELPLLFEWPRLKLSIAVVGDNFL